eukprot:GHVN01019488.1.p1 GENE.GHVN01019488.1~~GHVN01019488.1.p1  ORF type:complete len:484 (-),score=46.78 GHVN01019488.1:4160-5611(-)
MRGFCINQDLKGGNEFEIQVLFEDEGVVVLNKPGGLPTTTSKRNDLCHKRLIEVASTLAVLPMSKQTLVGCSLEQMMDPIVGDAGGGPCHRLDVGTSGCLIIAKTKSALASIREQFKAREVAKLYFCVSSGTLKSVVKYLGEEAAHAHQRSTSTGKCETEIEGIIQSDLPSSSKSKAVTKALIKSDFCVDTNKWRMHNTPVGPDPSSGHKRKAFKKLEWLANAAEADGRLGYDGLAGAVNLRNRGALASDAGYRDPSAIHSLEYRNYTGIRTARYKYGLFKSARSDGIDNHTFFQSPLKQLYINGESVNLKEQTPALKGSMPEGSQPRSSLTYSRMVALGAGNSNQAAAVFVVKPVTGRKHQIRVHLSRLGLPVVGDDLYGQERTTLNQAGRQLNARLEPTSKRTLLHSAFVKFFLPLPIDTPWQPEKADLSPPLLAPSATLTWRLGRKGKEIRVFADIPSDMEEAMRLLDARDYNEEDKSLR